MDDYSAKLFKLIEEAKTLLPKWLVDEQTEDDVEMTFAQGIETFLKIAYTQGRIDTINSPEYQLLAKAQQFEKK